MTLVVLASTCLSVVVDSVDVGWIVGGKVRLTFCIGPASGATGIIGIPAIALNGVFSSSVVGANPPDKIIIMIKISTGMDKNMHITKHLRANLSGDVFVLRARLDGSIT